MQSSDRNVETAVREALQRRAALAKTSPDALARIREQTDRKSPARLLPRMALAGAAAAVVAVGVVAVTGVSDRTAQVEIEPAVPGGGADATAPGPDSVPVYGWEAGQGLDGAFELSGYTTMFDVATVGRWLVAVGDTGEQTREARAVVWWSEDAGRSWEALPADPIFGGGQTPASMLAVAASGDGVVAAGAFDGRPTVWHSPEVHSGWQRVEVDTERRPGVVRDILRAGPGLLAVGEVETDNGGRAVIWASTDGRSWTPVLDPGAPVQDTGAPVQDPGAPVLDPSTATWSTASHIVPTANGLLAIGSVAGEHGLSLPALWLSDDGLAWRAVTWPLGHRPTLDAVTSTGELIVALGNVETDTGMRLHAYASRDGRDWARWPQVEDNLHAYAGGVVAVADGLVAVGTRNDGDPAEPRWSPAAWWSADGTTWIRLPSMPDDRSSLSAVTATADGLVAVGLRRPAGEGPVAAAAVWRLIPGPGAQLHSEVDEPAPLTADCQRLAVPSDVSLDTVLDDDGLLHVAWRDPATGTDHRYTVAYTDPRCTGNPDVARVLDHVLYSRPAANQP